MRYVALSALLQYFTLQIIGKICNNRYMRGIETAEALRPYLNPEYWGGHAIGDGKITGAWPSIVGDRGAWQAKRAMQDRLGLMEKVVPVKTYVEGQTFDANDYELRTIVLFREESLMGPAEELGKNAKSLADAEILPRPVDVPSTVDGTNTARGIRDGKLGYSSDARWGIVGLNEDREKVLHTVSAQSVRKLGAGRIAIGSVLSIRPGLIDIGETEHYKSRNGRDRLTRINLLDVVALGEPKKQETRSLLGSLTTRWEAARA